MVSAKIILTMFLLSAETASARTADLNQRILLAWRSLLQKPLYRCCCQSSIYWSENMPWLDATMFSDLGAKSAHLAVTLLLSKFKHQSSTSNPRSDKPRGVSRFESSRAFTTASRSTSSVRVYRLFV
jgi:hypothetical protein